MLIQCRTDLLISRSRTQLFVSLIVHLGHFHCLNLGRLPIQGFVRLSGVVSFAPMG
jgi:hypothetical protein